MCEEEELEWWMGQMTYKRRLRVVNVRRGELELWTCVERGSEWWMCEQGGLEEWSMYGEGDLEYCMCEGELD